MLAVLWGFVFASASLMALLVAALLTPIKLRCVAVSAPAWRLKVGARLFGGLTPAISIHDSARGNLRKKRQPQKRKTKAPVFRRRLARGLRRIIGTPRLFADLLRPIRLECLKIHADLGLDDPADTGQLFGVLAPLTYALFPQSKVSIEQRPDFSGPGLSADVLAELRFTPLAFLFHGARIAWHVFGPHR